MIKTILVAVDGSPRARGVFDAAAELGRGLRARLILYRALIIPQEFPAAAATTAIDDLPAFLDREARAQLSAYSQANPDVACELRIEPATQPWRSILAAADAAEADLIVLGSHGYGGWDHVLGTTAGKVANVSHRSVLVVHGAALPNR